MKYFVTLVYVKNDGIYDRSTTMYYGADSAEQGFYQALITAISKPENVKAIVFMYNENGKIEFKRVWKREE